MAADQVVMAGEAVPEVHQVAVDRTQAATAPNDHVVPTNATIVRYQSDSQKYFRGAALVAAPLSITNVRGGLDVSWNCRD